MRSPSFRVLRMLFKGPERTAQPVVLKRPRLFILPTKLGVLFGLFLLVMLLGGINYENNLIFVVTFLLASAGVISILHTYRNLLGLSISPGRADPVFAGEPARFKLLLHNSAARKRFMVELVRKKESSRVDVPGTQTVTAAVTIKTTRRGRLELGPIKVQTLFPFGLFRAWSNLHPDLDCIVYPTPEQGDVPIPPEKTVEEDQAEQVIGGPGVEEYQGVRDYRAGDSFRRVVWKALSRGHELVTKEFMGSTGKLLWLDFDGIIGPDVESRLSRLTRLVLEASARQYTYGLSLPGVTIEPDKGEAHMRRCLTALALY